MVTYCDVLMEKMLDAGFCLPAIASRSIRPEQFDPELTAEGLMVEGRRGGRGYSIIKGSYPYLSSIRYPVSSIKHRLASMIVFTTLFFLVSACLYPCARALTGCSARTLRAG